jgi:hypothetical protein
MRFIPNNPWLKILFILLAAFLLLVLVGVVIGMVKSYQTNKHPGNSRFKNGYYPSASLDGRYQGSWMGNQTTWQGKEFFAASKTGINNFSDGQRYKFKTYKAKSISSDKEVLKIDYDIAGNPFWIRRIVDELVEAEPGKYQGKVYIKYLPGLTFSLTYFTLEK